jgi:hypothetical protein
LAGAGEAAKLFKGNVTERAGMWESFVKDARRAEALKILPARQTARWTRTPA